MAADMARKTKLEQRIVDTAIDLAEEIGWGGLRLRLVAERLGVPLSDALAHYRDLDAVADAWFDRAWKAMLAAPPKGFAALPATERIHIVMMRWFDALEPHRRVTGEMLAAKMHAPHPHHWAPMIFNLSRTIQWLREAAILDAGGRRRQVEEIGLSALFLATLRCWLGDGTPDQERTRAFLARRLDRADRLMARVWPPEAGEGA